MLITVIVPVYNVENLLRECCDSLLRQELSGSYEILLVDDGSRDASGRICDEYAARYPERVRVIHQTNRGAGAARNTGIDHARGEYLVFCDADDWVDPNYLQQFLDADMDGRTMPFTGIRQHREGQSDRMLVAPPMEVSGAQCVDAIIALRRCDMLGYSVNKMLVRRIIDENHLRFTEGLSLREDEIFMLEYVRHVSRIVVNQKSPYHYRILGSGLTKRRKAAELILRVAARLRDLFDQAAPTPEGRYVGARIYLQQTCEAVAASRSHQELQAAVRSAREARRDYLQTFDPAFLKDRRDHKVARRSRWVFALGSRSARLLHLLTRLIHI